jgi:hypothetical protein
MDYPGRIIKTGEQDGAVVRALKQQLVLALGDADGHLALDPSSPSFGPRMRQAVKLFQARHVDAQGRALKQDGEVGAITWAALFGASSVPRSQAAPSDLLERVLKLAAAEEARPVREQPRNSNRGPQVDAYLKRVGLGPGYAWCCAFVYYCFDEAARQLGRPNPMLKTAGCMDHWRRAASQGARLTPASEAMANPQRVQPGAIFIMDHGRGLGHTGLIERMDGGWMTTLEGNTDASKTREGGGVYRLTRKVAEVNRGYIDYGGRG